MISWFIAASSTEKGGGKKDDKRMTNAISLFLYADILCMPDVSKTIAIFF